jgi:hypothetical protein
MQRGFVPSLDNVDPVTATIVVVGSMERLMKVADEVDEKTQSLRTGGKRELSVSNDFPISVDLRDHAIITPAIALRIVARASDWDVHKMPRSCARAFHPYFIRPGGGVHHPDRCIATKQFFDLSLCGWCQTIGGY